MLQVKDLQVTVPSAGGSCTVIEDVTFTLRDGEVLGLVGESGCGKSMTAKGILGLLPKGARIAKGSVKLDGDELAGRSPKEYRPYRGKKMSMIFQDSMASLNPLMRIGRQMEECYALHFPEQTAGERRKAVQDDLKEVGFQDPDEIVKRYPHQLSGGQRQRIMIAMALTANPTLLIADEPTTALDVSTQKRILLLIRDLQKRYGTSVLFISHDISVIESMADRIGVMYLGWLVEEGNAEDVLHHPMHPYTQALLQSVPKRAEKDVPLATISGTVPSLEDRPQSGCVFADRCPYQNEACRGEIPFNGEDGGHRVRCVHALENSAVK